MKIISYNIADSKQWKITVCSISMQTFSLCPKSPASSKPSFLMSWKWRDGITWQFAGKPKWKGLGMIWRKGHGHIAPWYNPELYYAIPLFVDDVLILGFWGVARARRGWCQPRAT